MSEKEFVKIGFMGCGWIAKSMSFLVKFTKNTKVVAGADLVLKNAEKIVGKKHAYTDIDEMLEKEDIDAVYIALPHHLHKPMIKKAFEAGKHIICEKPVTISVEDAREIKQLDEKYSDLKLGFNYDRRYNYDCYKIASGIQAGHLGNVYFATCTSFYNRKQEYFDKGPWRGKKETCGGGTLLIHTSHMIDILCWALGEPKRVIGKIDTKKFTNINVEDVGFGTVEFENGALAQINGTMIANPKIGKIPDSEELHFFGEKGRAHFRGMSPFTKTSWHGVKKYKIERINRGFHNLMRSIKAYSDWILNDKPFLSTVDESSKALRLLMALYKSSETGKKEIIEKL